MKVSKIIKNIVCVSMVALSLCISSCGNANNEKADTEGISLEGLVTEGKLTFVADDSVVPCVYRNSEDKLEGFEYDCGNAIAEYLGLEPVWISNAWENLITTIQAGKADAIADGMYITDERKEVVDFCESYYSMEGTIIVAKGNDTIYKPEDLVGKKVGVQPASPDLENVKALGVKDITEYSRIPDGIQDLTNGRIDAYVTESLSAAYYAKNGEYELRQEESIGSFEAGIATSKDAPEVTKAINSAIRALKEDGTFSDISRKWFDEDIIQK